MYYTLPLLLIAAWNRIYYPIYNYIYICYTLPYSICLKLYTCYLVLAFFFIYLHAVGSSYIDFDDAIPCYKPKYHLTEVM